MIVKRVSKVFCCEVKTLLIYHITRDWGDSMKKVLRLERYISLDEQCIKKVPRK